MVFPRTALPKLPQNRYERLEFYAANRPSSPVPEDAQNAWNTLALPSATLSNI